MTWQLYRWVWQLQSPLFVGSTPAGMLNRCRLYIPARTMWGALTAEIARSQNVGIPNYKEVGVKLKEGVRFSYLYPAELDEKKWRAWLPAYEDKKGLGLVWRREGMNDDSSERSDREMRLRLLHTRPSTSINPDTYSAEDGSLRETECIQSFWRTSSSDLSPVSMAGYLFIRDLSLLEQVERIRWLFVGGDTRYGLGRLKRVEWSKADKMFNMESYLNEEEAPIIEGDRVLAHSKSSDERMRGAFEVLLGWDRNLHYLSLSDAEPWFVPGSYCETIEGECKLKWKIESDGFWRERI